MVYTINNEQLTRRIKVTIDGSKVTSETAIPLMLNINLPGVKAAGADVRVAKLDGTPIAREIECINVPNTDDVTLYLPFDTVSGTDSQFYVYWAPGSALTEPAADSTYGSQAVWDANYVAVWHFNTLPVTEGLIDSTGNGHNGTAAGTLSDADLVDGAYGKNVNLDSGEYFTVPGGAWTVFNTLTFLNKLKFDSYNTYQNIMSTTTSGQGDNGFWVEFGSTRGHTIYSNTVVNLLTDDVASLTGLSTGTDYIFDITYDGAAIRGKYNNTLFGDNSISGSIGTNLNPLLIGRYHKTSTTMYLDAKLDEYRISNIARSDNYQSTTYNNLNNPTATGTIPFFASFGHVEHQRRTPQFM